MAQNKNNWDVNELQKAKIALEEVSFEVVGDFIDANIRSCLESMLNRNIMSASLLSKELARIIEHVSKEKDLEFWS